MYLITVLHTLLDRAFASDKAPTLPSALYRACEPIGDDSRASLALLRATNRSIKQARPTTALRFLVSPLNGAPSTSAPPYGSLLEALCLLLVPKFAMLWRRGLARFMTSALHFARLLKPALWPPPEGELHSQKIVGHQGHF